MERFRGKVAIVTGASAGIGAAIAKRLSDEGVKVVGFARRIEPIEELSKKCKENPIVARKVDVSNPSEIIENVKWVCENVGPLHIIINNAAIFPTINFIDGNIENLKKALETNVLGVICGCQEAIKVMEKLNIEGHIININSVAGHFILNYPDMNIYPATKHALIAATEGLRRELAARKSKIKISSLSPGSVKTDIANQAIESSEIYQAWLRMPKLKPEDVADAVVYVIGTPPSVHIAELIIRPLGEEQ